MTDPTLPTAADADEQIETVPSAPTFGDYVDELTELLGARHSAARVDGVIAALDGEVSRRLRDNVPLAVRRSEGAFFTNRALADKLLAGDETLIVKSAIIADAACGAGDLLLAAARALPTASTVSNTLRMWGRRLVGRDLNPLYVRTTRLRLALLASSRNRRSWRGDDDALRELLPEVCVGDGTELHFSHSSTLLLLNPPFGATITRQPWGEGRVARAGVFTAQLADELPHGATLRAILPDVLRSGSNYGRWRDYMDERLEIGRVQPVGRFDPWTDVDVFLLAGTTSDTPTTTTWWPPASALPDIPTLADHFEVRVGPVVPHRDAIRGDESPYLRAHDLPQNGEYRPGAVRLKHRGPRFKPPLVVIRRTSRPERGSARIIATIIRGAEPVLAENHLLVCVPRDGKLRTCRRLVDALAMQQTTDWLDQRLRCRHLTVAALREVPLEGWPNPASQDRRSAGALRMR